jgi:CHAT domain
VPSLAFSVSRSVFSGSYRIRGNFLAGVSGFLEKVDYQRLGRLVRQSKLIGGILDGSWIDSFRDIGQELLEELFRNNYSFNTAFNQSAAPLVGDGESVRIRFIVSTSAHPLACEALIDDNNAYRILQLPVYRKINESTQAFFFEPESELKGTAIERCLIVVADTHGIVSGVSADIILRKLSHISEEGKQLEDCLTKNGIFVRRLGGPGGVTASRDQLVADLERGTWDAVHFAGHSFWDEKGNAMIFLPGAKGPESLTIEPLAVLLRKARTRFVYLSSCSSSGCAAELARKQVSAIVGHRWEVDDELGVLSSLASGTNNRDTNGIRTLINCVSYSY